MGSGGGGGQTSTNKFEPPEYTIPYWQQYVANTAQLTQQGLPQWQGPTVAELTDPQVLGLQRTMDVASSANPNIEAANQNAFLTLTGKVENPYANIQSQVAQNPLFGDGWRNTAIEQQYQTYDPDYIKNGGQNPYAEASNPYYQGTGQTAVDNPYYGMNLNVGSNPYMGDNPYLEQMIKASADQMTGAYQRGTAAQTDAMFARNRAYGGSAYQEAVAANQAALAKQLADTNNQYRFQNYQQSADLAEADIARRMQAAQGDIARNAGMFETEKARQTQLGESGSQRGWQGFENAAGRQLSAQEGKASREQQMALQRMNLDFQGQEAHRSREAQLTQAAIDRAIQAQQFDLSRGAAMWDAERNRQMQLMGFGYQDQANDFNNAQRMIGVGDALRGYNQELVNDARTRFSDPYMNNFRMQDILGNALSRASGGMGTNTGTTNNDYRTSPLATAVGAGLLGYGLMRG